MSSNRNNNTRSFGIGKNKQNQKQPQPIKKGLKAWEDEEIPSTNNDNNTKNPNKPKNTQSLTSNKTNQISNNTLMSNTANSQKSTSNSKYPGANPLKSTYDYENKILDGAFAVSGISLKPSEGEMNDILKRIKTLNNQVIFQLMIERINQSIDSDLKTLTKIIYIIEAIVKDKLTSGYIDLFKANAKMFQEIYEKNLGKKINQLASDIHKILTGRQLMPVISSLKSQGNESLKQNMNMNITNQNANKQKFNFIKKKQVEEPISSMQMDVVGVIQEEDKKEEVIVNNNFNQQNQTQIQQNNNNTSNTDLFDLFSQPQKVENKQSIPTLIPENDSIKNNDIQSQIKEDDKPKKGFVFIKSKGKNNNTINNNNNINYPTPEQIPNLLNNTQSTQIAENTNNQSGNQNEFVNLNLNIAPIPSITNAISNNPTQSNLPIQNSNVNANNITYANPQTQQNINNNNNPNKINLNLLSQIYQTQNQMNYQMNMMNMQNNMMRMYQGNMMNFPPNMTMPMQQGMNMGIPNLMINPMMYPNMMPNYNMNMQMGMNYPNAGFLMQNNPMAQQSNFNLQGQMKTQTQNQSTESKDPFDTLFDPNIIKEEHEQEKRKEEEEKRKKEEEQKEKVDPFGNLLDFMKYN